MNCYYCPGAGKIRGMKLTLADRIRMWRKRRERMKTLTY